MYLFLNRVWVRGHRARLRPVARALAQVAAATVPIAVLAVLAALLRTAPTYAKRYDTTVVVDTRYCDLHVFPPHEMACFAAPCMKLFSKCP